MSENGGAIGAERETTAVQSHVRSSRFFHCLRRYVAYSTVCSAIEIAFPSVNSFVTRLYPRVNIGLLQNLFTPPVSPGIWLSCEKKQRENISKNFKKTEV